MTKDPAMLFYTKDWLEGTAEYMPDEKGIYIDLLCHQHQKGSLPADTIRLARMVGVSHEEFLKIWDVIHMNFEKIEDRFVNLKLENVRNQRTEKSKINTITGTFAGLLRLGKFSPKVYKLIRSNFKPTDFIQYEKEELTDRLTDWLGKCLKSIENGNANAIGNGNKDIIELYDSIVVLFDERCRPKTIAQKNKWLDTLDKCIRIDGYSPEQIKTIIKKMRMDDFWRTNFMSVMKLRDTDKQGIKYIDKFYLRIFGVKQHTSKVEGVAAVAQEVIDEIRNGNNG
jgi:hypothetical protein